ncbi:MAG: hypothetical protein AD742_01510 [Methylibium sp. NZG]|nr:MAG: hypothetical protein AD742_01510 [Methylibium sp. NZG]
MNNTTGFRLPRPCLPAPGIDLKKWAVVACDQYTAEPDYWREVEAEVGDAPSTLKLIFPEVHLGAADAPARIARIQQTMREYLADGLLREHDGAILVERTVHGRTRRGLMLELDLAHYDFRPGSTSLIRPTEGTIVARLAPRIEVRRGAELELPHILVLIDDPQHTVIEPIAAARAGLAPLYDTELMQEGGHVAGFAVSAAAAERAMQALNALADPRAFAARYGVPAGTPPMLFAVGDGNHSLATAKSIWDAAKSTVGPDHPSRWALVEVENIHDPALHFEPIHRLLFGVTADVRRALADAFGPRLSCTDVASAAAMRERLNDVNDVNGMSATGGARHVAGMIGPGIRFSVLELADPPAGLAVGTFQAFIDNVIARGGAREVDYVHGDDVLERLAVGERCIGLHLAGVGKSELLKRVVHDGPLPRKTFSMGEAHEKRFYVEARRIR